MITLICGLPRAGKTTYSKRFENKCKVIHLDEYGSPQKAYNRVLRKISPGEDVVIDGVYNRANQRKALVQMFANEKTVCIWLDTPISVKKTRRGYSKHCEYPFEPPTYEEGWDEIVVLGENYE